jgi:hypothetical protein
MAAQPNMVDASQISASGIKVGSCKWKQVNNPLNSEVERTATLLVKKKSCLLEKTKHSESGVALKLMENVPQGHPASSNVIDTNANTEGPRHTKDPVLHLSDEENEEGVSVPLLELTPGHKTPSKGPMGGSGDEETEALAESEEVELGASSCIC